MVNITRRLFGAGLMSAVGTAALAGPATATPSHGPNVIIIRFGGGVRRAETIGSSTYAPYMMHKLATRGVLIPNMMIEQLDDVATSHSEGTINILTGRYLAYTDQSSGVNIDRLIPTKPTLFDYAQRKLGLAPHQAILINGEDRPQEEYLTIGAASHNSVELKSEMLSLYRYKLHKFNRIITEQGGNEEAVANAKAEIEGLLGQSTLGFAPPQSTLVEKFWDDWRHDFGDTGLVNPRGDRLLTELALRAMRQLKPRLMMVNYQDTDYVHWGLASHYTRAIAIIDQGIQQIVEAADNSEYYHNNTVFVIVPDCGRDANGLMEVPFQHHFNSRSAHEIWALIAGPGIHRNRVLDKRKDQSAIAATVAALMGFKATESEGDVLNEVLT